MSHRSSLLFLSVFTLLLAGCQDHKDPSIENFGQIDSSLIAADTTMQVNMDRSYEFQKTLVKNDTEVYDFLAYDKPKGSSNPEWESKFIVIRRTSTRRDTVIKDFRFGPVKGLTLADMDQDGRPEILFYEDHSPDKYSWIVRIYSLQADGKYNEIRLKEYDAKSISGHYRDGDTFFVAQNYLIRKTPYYEKQKDNLASGYVWQSYHLSGGKLILAKEKMVLQ
jgi:hypothetical protein